MVAKTSVPATPPGIPPDSDSNDASMTVIKEKITIHCLVFTICMTIPVINPNFGIVSTVWNVDFERPMKIRKIPRTIMSREPR